MAVKLEEFAWVHKIFMGIALSPYRFPFLCLGLLNVRVLIHWLKIRVGETSSQVFN